MRESCASRRVVAWWMIVAIIAMASSCSGGSGGPTDLGPAPILGSCLVEPNYVGQVVLNRWRDFPLRYYFAESTFPAQDRDRILGLILQGMQAWAVATDGRIGSLVAAGDSIRADLIIQSQDVGTAGAYSTHGTGTPYLARGHIVFDTATIVGAAQIEDGALLTALAAHETGHILGIIGHPSMQGVLMHDLTPRVPTTTDVNTLSHAYCRSNDT